MLESLRRIQNPWVRSLTAATTALSVVTVVSAIALGTKRDNSAYRSAVYAALIAAGGGAVLGWVYKGGETGQQQSFNRQSESNHQPWKDWRNFVVMRKVKESNEITSFYLRPEDGGKIPNFQPGQFLPIKLDIPGQGKPVLRTYSLSDYSESCDYYRLSIKRELAPKGLDVPPGLSSNFMHDQVHEGSTILAKPPSGKFVLEVHNTTPTVLVSNGVGITPMIAMAKASSRLNPNRPLWFLHGARDGQHHAFREEVVAIAQQSPNLKVHFAYSRPQSEDEGCFQSTGYVDTPLIQSLVTQDAEFYLCGSPSFMQSVMDGLKAWGVPDSKVFFESFGPGKKETTENSTSSDSQNDAESEITFSRSSKTLTWSGREDNLLEFAEANDLEPDYSCRQGICGTCMCAVMEGEVEYVTEPTAEIAEGSALICIAKPKTSRVVLDI